MTTITGVGKLSDKEGNELFDPVGVILTDEGTGAASRSRHVFHGKVWDDNRDLFSDLKDNHELVVELPDGQMVQVKVTGFTHGGSHAEVVGDVPLPLPKPAASPAPDPAIRDHQPAGGRQVGRAP